MVSPVRAQMDEPADAYRARVDAPCVQDGDVGGRVYPRPVSLQPLPHDHAGDAESSGDLGAGGAVLHALHGLVPHGARGHLSVGGPALGAGLRRQDTTARLAPRAHDRQFKSLASGDGQRMRARADVGDDAGFKGAAPRAQHGAFRQHNPFSPVRCTDSARPADRITHRAMWMSLSRDCRCCRT
jgi:hypothetical protein